MMQLRPERHQIKRIVSASRHPTLCPQIVPRDDIVREPETVQSENEMKRPYKPVMQACKKLAPFGIRVYAQNEVPNAPALTNADTTHEVLAAALSTHGA